VNRLIAARAGDKPCGADEFFPALLYTVLKVEVSPVCSAFFSQYTALLYTVLKVDLCAVLGRFMYNVPLLSRCSRLVWGLDAWMVLLKQLMQQIWSGGWCYLELVGGAAAAAAAADLELVGGADAAAAAADLKMVGWCCNAHATYHAPHNMGNGPYGVVLEHPGCSGA
jgi:hypothetical protein